MSNQLIPQFTLKQYYAGQYHGEFEAISLFVDISGFTVLTESLMQHRRGGAEALTQALNAIFNPLVQAIYDNGGFITTYAGDAFTALFAVEDSAAGHAIQAAERIQQSFQQRAKLQTPYGDFMLAAKIGLGYGPIEWGILKQGDQHTYFYRGDALQSCTAAEQKAQQGDIILDPALLPMLGDQITTEAVNGHYKLIGHTLELPIQPFTPEAPDNATFKQFMLRDVVELATPAELRDVASMFIGFSGDGGDEFTRQVMSLTESYGGFFRHVDYGDKGAVIVVLFGTPVAYDNNVMRAADFALALQELDPVDVDWRIGLTFGEVYAGFIGGQARSDYAAIGDIVNLAVRIMTRADSSAVWVSAEVQRLLEERGYNFDPMGAQQFKGKSQPLQVYQLTGKVQQMGFTNAFAGKLIGRDAELKQLETQLDALDDQFGGVIYVYGDAGSGKSRLIHELQQRTSKLTWFTCPTDDILRQSLNPFRQFLRRYFDQNYDNSAETNEQRLNEILDSLINELEEERGADDDNVKRIRAELDRTRSVFAALVDLRREDTLYAQLDPKLRFENSLIALKTLIQAESLINSVVLNIEDAHWLDDGSLEFLTMLTRNVADYPFVVIVTSRYLDSSKGMTIPTGDEVPTTTLDLEKLSNDALHGLIEQTLGARVDSTVSELVTRRADGNPFFAEQLALDLQERDLLTRGRGRVRLARQPNEVDVPVSISTVLVARLDRLTGKVKYVVQTASVLGQEFEVNVLSRMLKDDDALSDKVRTAEESSIWQALSEIRYLFQHGLMRDAAYDMQLRVHLRRMHTAAAEAIAELYADDLAPRYADLAYHYGKAEQPEQERHYAKLAGDYAASNYANQEAVEYYSRALELTDDPDSRFDLLLAREEVYALFGSKERRGADIEALANLAEQLGDPEKTAEALLRQASYSEMTGDYEAAVIKSRELAAQTTATASQQARAYERWGTALVRQGKYPEAGEILQKALKLTEADDLLKVRANVLRTIGIVAIYQGDYEGGDQYVTEALAIYRQINDRPGEARALNTLGGTYFYRGYYEQTLEVNEQVLEICRQIGDRFFESTVIGNLGVITWNRGDYGRCISYFNQSIDVAKETGNQLAAIIALNNLGATSVTIGQFQHAKDSLEQALLLSRKAQDRQREMNTLNALGLMCLHQGDYEQALAISNEELALAIEAGSQAFEANAHEHIAHSLMGQRQLDEACQHYEQSLKINTELKNGLVAPLNSMLGALEIQANQPEKALAHIEKVLAYLETDKIPATADPASIYFNVYHVLDALDDPRKLEVLKDGYEEMTGLMNTLGDEDQKQIFIENIPAHRALMAAWREHFGDED